jgi:hypothetical protein
VVIQPSEPLHIYYRAQGVYILYHIYYMIQNIYASNIIKYAGCIKYHQICRVHQISNLRCWKNTTALIVPRVCAYLCVCLAEAEQGASAAGESNSNTTTLDYDHKIIPALYFRACVCAFVSVLQKQSKAQKRREKKAAEDAERDARIAAGRGVLDGVYGCLPPPLLSPPPANMKACCIL